MVNGPLQFCKHRGVYQAKTGCCCLLQRVRFATEEVKPTPKVETHDASVWTETPDYDNFLFVRMYTPVSMKQEDLKCSVTFGKQFYKTKRLEPYGKIESYTAFTVTAFTLTVYIHLQDRCSSSA